MDIEFAVDSHDGHIYVVQSRPETVMSQKDNAVLRTYRLQDTAHLGRTPEGARVLGTGLAVGNKIGSGTVRIILDSSPNEMGKVQPGDVVVTDLTTPRSFHTSTHS
jgi:pyruvate,water dikinase